MKVDAVILAGGKLKDSDQDKAFIKLGEQTLLDRTIQTLSGCSSISKIIVTSAPVGFGTKLPVDELLHDEGDLLKNIVSALHKVETQRTLIVSSDIPLTTAEHVSEFLNSCAKVSAGIYYPLIPKSSMGPLSSMKRTYFKLDKTEFTGGNIMLLEKDIFLDNIGWARAIYTNRKSPVKLGRLVGPYFLAKLVLGKLAVSEAESKAGKILGCTVRGIIIPRPEIGSDIDKKEDLKFIERIFEGH
jgi:molybdopterin-guanine dinucleotide biosynthesis protein A